jgi:MFS family permease
MLTRAVHRSRSWFQRWSPILPLLLAEAVVWAGFGALLPIMPLYFTEHGTDVWTLGFVIAAWPAARLIGEPVFGWLADRAPRKPLMIVGLLVTGVATILPIVLVGPLAFLLLRALAGLATSLYDPAARGYLVDANPADRQGETFGLYGAAQMGGLMLGPAIGGLAAAASGQPTIVFWVAGIACFVSAVLVAVRVPELASTHRHRTGDADAAAGAAGDAVEPAPSAQPHTLRNRFLVAAIVMNVGWYFAGGSYEVIWSLYLTSIGGTIEVIGLTFAAFALPVLIVGPFAGRLVDQRGGWLPLVGGMAVVAGCAPLYPVIPEPWFVIVLSLVEGTAFAIAAPALFALVARASPAGQSSTAQGIFGAAGTIGTIAASILAGVLASVDLRLPYYVVGIAGGIGLVIGLAVAGGGLRALLRPVADARDALHRPALPPTLAETPPFG